MLAEQCSLCRAVRCTLHPAQSSSHLLFPDFYSNTNLCVHTSPQDSDRSMLLSINLLSLQHWKDNKLLFRAAQEWLTHDNRCDKDPRRHKLRLEFLSHSSQEIFLW